ncbi:peptidase [Photobacterium angustum]|uniref:pilin n=1 Tax=Photobacterium angustum TaxID=661 RepID=UPI0005E2AA5E|nr:prepilin-type N-terminal cleavage/methylation domain-containing protein [Photobacterium angustum]KJG05396.1 peptidase [Photobacterium angustum]PSV90705.1 prepilin-type N-terminal cleavage/methylation domain-containing protein [Photobacterium angustum]
MKKQQGFTLIELMIVVAIIGIISAFAIPAYSDYTQKTRLAGTVAGITSYKTAVALCGQENGAFTTCNHNTNGIPDTIAANNAGATINYVDALTVASGAINVTSTGVNSSNAKMVLTFTPTLSDGAIRWGITGTGCASATNTRGINCNN